MGDIHKIKTFKTFQRNVEQVPDRNILFDDVDSGGYSTGANPTIPADEITETIVYENSDNQTTKVKVPQ
jgi:hypothetical protein